MISHLVKIQVADAGKGVLRPTKDAASIEGPGGVRRETNIASPDLM